MPLHDILEQIKKQAEDEIAKLDEACEQALAAIKDEYSKQRDIKRAEMEVKVKGNAAKIKERTEAFARIETRNHLLSAKRKILEKVFEKSLKALLESPDYETIVVALLKEAAHSFESGTVIPAKGKEKDLENALKKAGSPFKMSEQSAPIQGGFLLESGNVEGNFSFDSILKKELWEGLELKLNQLLFA